MKKIQLVNLLVLCSIIIPSATSLLAVNGLTIKVNNKTENQIRIENQENNIERIRINIDNATATEKKEERLNNRFENQQRLMVQAKERILNQEIKLIDVLEKIFNKINERINIIEDRGINMSLAKTKLNEANTKIEKTIAKADELSTLLNTEITDLNKEQIFIDIQNKRKEIKDLAREAHTLLVETVKTIAQNLGNKTATSTNN